MLDRSSVVITGASSGIGRELARHLADRVSGLALVARRRDRLDELKSAIARARPSLRVTVHACDLVNRGAIDTMLAEVTAAHERVDVLINNAGVGQYGRFADADWDALSRMMRLNVEAHTYLVHRVLPGMLARGWGRIANVASGQGFQSLPGFASYAATKHYVVGFTECLQMELRGTGVAATLVCPGHTRTEFFDGAGQGSDELLPSFMAMDAAPVARAAVRAIEAGAPLVIPGFRNRVALWLGAISPRSLRHWLLMLRFASVEGRRRLAPAPSSSA
jgi:uncharacterized protein